MHHAPPMVYPAPVPHALLTWSDAGIVGPAPAHQTPRAASDRGPVLRLLDHHDTRYDAAWILTIPGGHEPTEGLARRVREKAASADVHVVEIDDPSDYKKLFRALSLLVVAAKRAFPAEGWSIDVLLSAG